MRARAQPEHRSPRLPQPWARAGPALRWAWRSLGLACCGARFLAGRGPGFVLGLRLAASSDANSYDTLPIKFPIPEFISDTNNI